MTTEMLADFLRDIDDPRRAVEINDLAEATTGRTGERAGDQEHQGLHRPRGASQLPVLPGARDQPVRSRRTLAAHQPLRVLYRPVWELLLRPRPGDRRAGHPGRGRRDDNRVRGDRRLRDVARRRTSRGSTEDIGLPPYDPAVCPAGTAPEHAEETLCDPGNESNSRPDRGRGGNEDGEDAPERGERDPDGRRAGCRPAGHARLDRPRPRRPRRRSTTSSRTCSSCRTKRSRTSASSFRNAGISAARRRRPEDLLDFLFGP